VGGPWSYPTGTERLTRVLKATRYGTELSASFHRQRGGLAKPPWEVLSVAYRPAFRGRIPAITSLLAPAWTIYVKAVPREHVGVIRKLVHTRALDVVAHWLDVPRSSTWLGERHSLEISFDPDGCVLAITER
jgi:hypothetical protein